MKDNSRKAKRISLTMIAVFVFIGAFGISVFAQGTRTMTPVDRRIERINRQIQESERDNMTREMKDKNRKAVNSKQNQAIKTQIKEDFEALQTAYNKIVVNLQSGNFERGFVLETTANVKKYAARLKDNLALPESEKEVTNEVEAEVLNLNNPRIALRTLCQHIYNFVTNPIFNEPTGLDIDQAANANREIDRIIELSEKIRETTEKLSN